jgi:hypothetical protein
MSDLIHKSARMIPSAILLERVGNGGYLITDGPNDRGFRSDAKAAFTTLPEALTYIGAEIWPEPEPAESEPSAVPELQTTFMYSGRVFNVWHGDKVFNDTGREVEVCFHSGSIEAGHACDFIWHYRNVPDPDKRIGGWRWADPE